MNLKNIVLSFLCLFFHVVVIQAQENEETSQAVLFNSKNVLVGISGDLKLLDTPSFEKKFVHNKVKIPEIERFFYTNPELMAQEFTNLGLGKQILDYLFQYDGTCLSEELLRERAFQCARLFDQELAEIGVIEKNTILKDDILPILENNYIIIKGGITNKKGKVKDYWYVFKVSIDKDILNNVYDSWNDMAGYNKIKVPVEFVAKGKINYNGVSSTSDKNLRKIVKKVPAFAIARQIAGHTPLCTAIGKNEGVNKHDRMFIYRTVLNGNGDYVSKKISTVRVGQVASDTAYLYTISGGFASRKKGDVAVHMPDNELAYSLTANILDGSTGVSISVEKMLGNNKYGSAAYLIFSLGASVYDGYWDKSLYKFNDEMLRSPIIVNGGFGWGFGQTLFHSMEFVPFFLLQWEGVCFQNESLNSNARSQQNQSKKDYWAHSFRIPVGAKVNINLWYPLQLSAGASYDFVVHKFNDEQEPFDYKRAEECFFEPSGYKRSGLNIFAGLRYCF